MITKEYLESLIVSKSFTTLPSGKTMVCELILRNGFGVIGKSGVVDIKKFDQTLGEKYSYDDAFNQIWQLEGYMMQTALFYQSMGGTVLAEQSPTQTVINVVAPEPIKSVDIPSSHEDIMAHRAKIDAEHAAKLATK